MDNTGISILSKGKAFASTNDIETYNKKELDNKIRKLITINVQLITDKMETEKTKVNLKADKTRLFNEKNSLVVKREKFRTEIAILNVTGSLNVLIYRYQNLFLRLI